MKFNIWVPPAILKTNELSIYLFFGRVLVESRTCFWSCSICFCCKCDSAVVCVSCKKATKNLTSEILSECEPVPCAKFDLGSKMLVGLMLTSSHCNTHTAAVNLQDWPSRQRTCTHTQRREKIKEIYLQPVFTHLIPLPRHTSLLTSSFLSTTCV